MPAYTLNMNARPTYRSRPIDVNTPQAEPMSSPRLADFRATALAFESLAATGKWPEKQRRYGVLSGFAHAFKVSLSVSKATFLKGFRASMEQRQCPDYGNDLTVHPDDSRSVTASLYDSDGQSDDEDEDQALDQQSELDDVSAGDRDVMILEWRAALLKGKDFLDPSTPPTSPVPEEEQGVKKAV